MRPLAHALVILGVAGVGKSTVARHCALRWPAKRHVDVATIRELLRDQHPDLALSTYNTWRLAGEEPTASNLAQGFERYVALLWPSVSRFLRWTAEEGNNIVIDGALLSPRLLDGFAIKGLQVHTPMLRVSDAELHFKRMKRQCHDRLSAGRAPRRHVRPYPLASGLPRCRVPGAATSPCLRTATSSRPWPGSWARWARSEV